MSTSFREALRRLDAAGRLVKVRREVSTDLEIAGILKHNDGDRALLFESVAGHGIPVVGNVLASATNVETALARDTNGVRAMMLSGLEHPVTPQEVGDPACQENVVEAPFELGDLLPVLEHAPGDGGRFLTAGVIIARDPDTGVHNASYHRLQLLGGSRTAIKLDQGRHLGIALERARALGRPLPISVCIGTDLALMYAAAMMGAQMPEGADELHAAGGVKGEPLRVSPAVSQDVVVAAESEIVLEGAISPRETAHEGPFAEFIGYHSDEGPAPVVEFTAVTHRTDPVYYAINGAGRETVMLRKYTLEAGALRAIRASVPIVDDVEMSPGGLHRFHIVIRVDKTRPHHEGLQRNAILAAFAAMKDLDLAIVVDADIDIRDPYDVEYALATRFEASRDLFVIPGARGHEYVRVSDGGQRAKVGLDATAPFAERERFVRAAFTGGPLEGGDAGEPGSPVVPWLDG